MKLVVALALSGSLFVSLACGPGDDDAGIGPSELQEWDCEMTATCRAASATVETDPICETENAVNEQEDRNFAEGDDDLCDGNGVTRLACTARGVPCSTKGYL